MFYLQVRWEMVGGVCPFPLFSVLVDFPDRCLVLSSPKPEELRL